MSLGHTGSRPCAHRHLLLLLHLCLLVEELYLLLLLKIGMLLGDCRHCFGALGSHTPSRHLVLNLPGLEAVVCTRLRLVQIRLSLLVSFIVLSLVELLLHLLLAIVLVRFATRSIAKRLVVLILLMVHLIIFILAVDFVRQKLVVFELSFVILHVDHFFATVVFILFVLIFGHDVLEVVLITVHLFIGSSLCVSKLLEVFFPFRKLFKMFLS